MKQSNNKKSRDVTAFLYERLSRDDNLEGESYSIGNQASQKHPLRQAESHLRALEQRGAACGMAGGMG